MDLDKLRDFVRIKRRIAELDSQLRSAKDEADRLQESLLEEYAQEGIPSITIDGMTVYMHRSIWASPAEGISNDRFVGTLKSVGLDHFVKETYSSQTLSAYVRELMKEEESLPEELEEAIRVTEKYSLRTRRAA